MNRKVRVGIVGVDHWYAGFGHAQQALRDSRVELVAVAHRDGEKVREFANQFRIPNATTDYRSVIQRDDIDLVAMACPTGEHAELVKLAASHKKHVIGIKPMAMNAEEGAAIVQAVKAAGVHYFPYESQYRLNPAWQQYKAHMAEGRMGRPVSAAVLVRGNVPLQDWPSRYVSRTWWLDPTQVFGGGWLDHSIYFIDALRWLWESEPTRVYGESSRLKHPDLQLEDYGMATIAFQGGQVASMEVTWTGAPDGYMSSCHLVGTKGQIVTNDPVSGKTASIGGVIAPGVKGWTLTQPYGGETNIISHLVDIDRRRQAPGCERGRRLPQPADLPCLLQERRRWAG